MFDNPNVEDQSYLIGPQPCGVYLLIDSSTNTVTYIGQTRNLPVRIDQHRRTKKYKFDKVIVHWCDPLNLDQLERDYINTYKPTDNLKGFDKPVTIRNLSLRVARKPQLPK